MKFKILIIDDNDDITHALKERYCLQKFEVLTAKNGEEALNLLIENKVDFILTDIEMPIMNGVEFIESIRSLKFQTPVAVMSGRYWKEYDTLKSLGVVFFFDKPFIDSKNLILDFCMTKN